ncbi:hypothetical protein ACFLT8_06025, partial [Chloroflexota bacterium]
SLSIQPMLSILCYLYYLYVCCLLAALAYRAILRGFITGGRGYPPPYPSRNNSFYWGPDGNVQKIIISLP